MDDRNPINENNEDQILEPFREEAGEHLTTNQKVRIDNTDASLKAGERDPTLPEDFYFREKTTHFDHKHIPERVVYA